MQQIEIIAVGPMKLFINKIFFSFIFIISSIIISSAGVKAQNANNDEAGVLSVHVNMARVLRINSPASTIIIGNPGIADVTIQDAQTLILTGKSYGQTNLIVLDSAGNPIADTLVEVIQTSDDVVTVYMGMARTTLSCEPICQPTVMLGDNNEYTSQVISSSEMIENAAQ